MGWWSCTVMGGDTPLDLQADLIEETGIKYCDFQDEHDFDMTALKEDMTRDLGKMIMYCEKQTNDYDYRNIAFQVLGAITMEAGVLLDDSVRAKIIDGAKNDEWATEDAERKQFMDAFILQVQTYENKPTQIAYESLFGKVFTALEENKNGLVNL